MTKVWETWKNQAYFKGRVMRMKSEGVLFQYQTEIYREERERDRNRVEIEEMNSRI